MLFTTIKEDWLTKLYKQNGIESINDLSIRNISKTFNLKVSYYPYRSRIIYDDEFALIYLKQGQTIEQTRYEFFHEFAHFLLHVYDQRFMDAEFVNYQEGQAHYFALYASMPRYIIEPLMENHRTLKALSAFFQLPESVVGKRVQQIKSQNISYNNYETLKHKQQGSKSSFLQGKVSRQTKLILQQLKEQVGEEKLSYEVKKILQ